MIFDYNVEGEDDRMLLIHFFNSLREGFRQIIYEGRWSDIPVSFFGEGLIYVRRSLEEVEPQFERAIATVGTVAEDRLRDFGLWGNSLRSKLYYVKYWASQALAGVAGAIGKTLGNINILLASFSAATGIGEAIKELKDVVLNNIDVA
ncbi:MAG: hypothetical protein KL839_21830 [Rhizobium sp.]|nr:hypothetical protein [Rhizobium sp.]